jgi:hypothetical protein
MRLIDNKKDISYGNITKRIYWKEKNVLKSSWKVNTRSLITSNTLIDNIYNDINRE